METIIITNERLRKQYENEGLFEAIYPFENWVNNEIKNHKDFGRLAIRTEEGIEIIKNK